ncbi:3-methyladenine DNA glycosylase Tag [Kaistia hirudinis]|uniref:3-methyladenine DNA glycosylase Tag n=1 Tax=Kaistia hirudinis TaxID=1293440 RepID=A0A840ATI9_9HYPH|nr:DNA-3-methyladenine glycosylase I [Kaistia hirudinis]MBB3932377.1 3-methyladenine DNA glycosylase Tag [Kaistia hirudinis]
MRQFAEIVALAASRKGGIAAVETLLAETPSRTPEQIAALTDDRILAAMTKRIFSAGLSHKMIEAKWPAFEAAFDRFDPAACAFMDDERFDALTRDASIVRNGAKIRAVQANAAFLMDLAREHGSAARFFANWPDADLVGLLDVMKRRGAYLGGDSGMRVLRDIGKPAFVATRAVVAALIREGVIDKAPSAKRDFAAIQAAFNAWSAQSGRDLTQISRILAMSTDD